MDSRIGLDYIVENKEYTAKLGSGAHIFPHLAAIKPRAAALPVLYLQMISDWQIQT